MIHISQEAIEIVSELFDDYGPTIKSLRVEWLRDAPHPRSRAGYIIGPDLFPGLSLPVVARKLHEELLKEAIITDVDRKTMRQRQIEKALSLLDWLSVFGKVSIVRRF